MIDETAPLGEQALEYADAYGYEVFPLIPTGDWAKAPLTPNGVLDASNDLNKVRAWWGAHPGALIGQRVPPDELILDVDPRHGGMDVFLALKDEFGIVPSRVHISGRGDKGGHLHFARPPGRLSGRKLAEWARERGLGEDLGNGAWTSGIDLLHHDHRYTILPASPHPVTGRPYQWRGNGPEDPPGSLPEGFVDLLRAPLPAGKPLPGPYDPDSIADWFSATQGFGWLEDQGWTLIRGDGTSDGSAWRHPKATNAVSATVRHRCLFVYTENTPFEVTMPADPAGYTPFRAWTVLCHGKNAKAAAREARKLKEAQDERDAAAGASPLFLHTVRPRHIQWLWHPFLPLGKMVIHAGEPGLMKSSFDIALAAQITRGTGFAEKFGPRPVVFLNYEDDDEDGLVPRLLAAGADLSLCASVPDELAHPAGLAVIVEQVGPLAVFVDPFGSWAESMENTGVETQIRASLKPLKQLARASGALVKVNCHPNKQNSLSDALYRIAGSLGGMVGYGRVVLASKRHEGHFVTGIVKSNVGPDEVGVEYFAQFVTVDLDDGTGIYPRVVFGSEVPIERENFFSSEKGEEPPDVRAAARIKEILEENENKTGFVTEIRKILVPEGFSDYAIRRGAVRLGVEDSGHGKNARWRLLAHCAFELQRHNEWPSVNTQRSAETQTHTLAKEEEEDEV